MGKEQVGLYYPDGTAKTRNQIRLKLLLEGVDPSPPPRHITSPPITRGFEDWTEVIQRRQKEREEVLGIPEYARIEIDTRRPIGLALVADVHSGGEDIDYQRFGKDVELIHSMGAYVITVGDLTDSYFFMPGVDESLTSSEEEVLYMRSALKYMAEDGHLLAGFGGDHDLWGKDKMGAHSLYSEFYEAFGAYYFEGVSYMDLGLNDGETVQNYPITGSHAHAGYSVYNDCHASLRQARDQGITSESDHLISFTAHKHVKGALTQVHKLHGGGEVFFHCLSLGTYKRSDRYARKHGWPRIGPKEQGATGVILYPGKQNVEICWDMQELAEKLAT